ncbi:hypothetical protein AK812_SmicGene18357 [Symbiodinium microadriaticum]|uniref:Uncharacterized protein n=1 Tax=Symbiodinium microadriaticum TaxID=2951 RepID=A0A1Q9DVC6_SYMMI|nr:hypothetical protein AK812_SmicGene18357 [Symbiodinium microadriaticum]
MERAIPLYILMAEVSHSHPEGAFGGNPEIPADKLFCSRLTGHVLAIQESLGGSRKEERAVIIQFVQDAALIITGPRRPRSQEKLRKAATEIAFAHSSEYVLILEVVMEAALRELLGATTRRERGGCSFPLPLKAGRSNLARPTKGHRSPGVGKKSETWQVMFVTATDRLEQAPGALRVGKYKKDEVHRKWPSCLPVAELHRPVESKEQHADKVERTSLARPQPWRDPEAAVDALGGARSTLVEAFRVACDPSPAAAAQRAEALSFLAQALAPLGGAFHAPSGNVAMAFCPFPLCSVSELGVKGFSCAPLPALPELPELSLQVLLVFPSGPARLRICLGDFFSGSYTLLLATLGYNSRHPGPASAWLKTYVLISFINGTMGHIDLVQNMLLHNFPALQLSLPISVNLMHVVQLLVPGVSFCGAYFGWQHLKMQRKVMVEAYQRELMMMLEHPPWPPPPLIPLPGMPPGALPPGPPAPAHGAAAQPVRCGFFRNARE